MTQTPGQIIRTKRAQDTWLKMWQLHTHPLTPLSVPEIQKKVKKKNGTEYTREYILEAFRKLKDRGLV